MRLRVALVALLAMSKVWAAPIPKAEYPRLGGTKFGSPHDYGDPAAQDQLAKLDVLLLDFFAAWGSPAQMRAVVTGIKARNPRIVVVDYIIQETIHNTYSGLQPLRDKLDAGHWWLYQNGGSGQKIINGDGTSTTNFTNAVPKDANGDRWNTWLAKYVYKGMWSQIPELDGTFTDNVFWKPRVNGDWNRDGTTDSEKDTTVYPAFRAGMVAHLNQLRDLMPGKLVLGNIGDWGRPEATVPEYVGQADGGLLEAYIGKPWSNEGVAMDGTVNGWGSWGRMMSAYRKVMGLVRAPRLVVFNIHGNPADYKTLRYALASCLMDDGYFDFSDGTSGSIYKPRVSWFDELDVAGNRTSSWLGAAVDPPQLVPWQKGVYRRRFQNGMALVNPRGNGAQAIDMGVGYARFKGVQDPAVNNGQAAGVVTIGDRDGLLLVGVSGLAVPRIKVVP